MENLHDIVKQQSEQISKLTDLFGGLFSKISADKHDQMRYNIPSSIGDMHIENLTRDNSLCHLVGYLNHFNEEEKNEVRKNLANNVRYRKHDKRYVWQKMIAGVRYTEIDPNYGKLMTKVDARKKQIADVVRAEAETQKLIKSVTHNKLIDLTWEWFTRHKEGKVASDARYKQVINKYITPLDKNIAHYTKDDIVDHINEIVGHRTQMYVCDILKNVFAEANEKGKVKKNVLANLKRPKNIGKKGTWIDLEGQRKILDNIGNHTYGEEILFYLMTGCRCAEAWQTTINFEKRVAFIDGTKSKTATRYVELSQAYCDRIKDKWHTMFKKVQSANHFSGVVTEFLKSIGIEEKTCHSLRHTFATNLYYLGIDDKRRQYVLGHSSIAMTCDVYTTLDPTIKKADIIKLYKNLYPTYTFKSDLKTDLKKAS